jgi:hypothetical protein
VAAILKRELKDDPDWNEFVKLVLRLINPVRDFGNIKYNI